MGPRGRGSDAAIAKSGEIVRLCEREHPGDQTQMRSEGGELIFKPADEILVRRIEKDEKVRQG